MIQHKDFNFSFDSKYCSLCGGKCCRGESGYIFASKEEIMQVAKFLHISFEEFAQSYLKKVGYRYSFLEKPDLEMGGYACIFFDFSTNGCSIYPVRPKQCKSYPFWDRYKQQIQEVLDECPATRKL